MSRLAIYESKVVSVVLGVLELGDGRSDPFFKIAPTGDAYVVEGPGADGQVTMCGTNNDVYEITLSFKGASSENGVLSAIHIADRKASNGAGVPETAADAGAPCFALCSCLPRSVAGRQSRILERGATSWPRRAPKCALTRNVPALSLRRVRPMTASLHSSSASRRRALEAPRLGAAGTTGAGDPGRDFGNRPSVCRA